MTNHADQNSNPGPGLNPQSGAVLAWSLRIQHRESKLSNTLLGLIILPLFLTRIHTSYAVTIIFILGNSSHNSSWQILNIHLIIGGFISGHNNLFVKGYLAYSLRVPGVQKKKHLKKIQFGTSGKGEILQTIVLRKF